MVARLVRFCERPRSEASTWMKTAVRYLRRDKLESRELPPCFLIDDVLDFRVGLRQRLVQDFVLRKVRMS